MPASAASAALPATQGHVAPGFEAVAAAFADNFTQRGELGAACAIHWRGEKVVDIWGGCKELGTQRAWDADTLALVYSLTKGITGLTTAVAVSKGLFSYDEPVTAVWPEFAAQGKGGVSIGELMSEQAGLAAIDLKLDAQKLADQDLLARTLAAQAPNWTPGTWAGNHSYSLGWLACELIRRRDPQRRSLGQFFSEYHQVAHAAVADHLYIHRGADAARHLFRVAAGLDSLVVGEPQILGQVKAAYGVASDRQFTAALTNRLFQPSPSAGTRTRRLVFSRTPHHRPSTSPAPARPETRSTSIAKSHPR